MKKVIIIFLAIVAVLIALAIIIPLAFKGPLVNKLKATINENVNATVEFSDLHLSLFKSFPRIQAELENLSISGKDQFQNDTLLTVRSIATNLSVRDLLGGDQIKIRSLKINDASIRLLSTQDGLVNWDIFPADSTETATADSTEEMAVSLQDIEIRNLNLSYKDELTATLVRLRNTDISASGELEGTITRFTLDSEVGDFMLEYDSIQYISNTVLKAKGQLEADYDKMNFVLGKTTLFLNELPLDISGNFQVPSDSMFFDLQFKQPQSDFATLLSMVPKTYQSYIAKVKTTGEAGFDGFIKGLYYEDNYPEISTRLYIKDATFQYEGSPEKIEQIALDGLISKPQGDFDQLSVNISDAHARIQDNPVNFRLSLIHPISDPEFDAAFEGKIDFTRLSKVIAMDSLRMSGLLEGNLAVKGKMSAIDQQKYDQVSSSGTFNFSNFSIKTPDITRQVEISSGNVKVQNTEITLSSFNGKTGQSDFQLNGKLSNYLPYFFLDRTLQGDFNLKSNYLNFDELAGLMAEKDSAVTAPADSMVAFQVPANLNLVFRSQINRASFDKMDIRNIDGLITIKNRILHLQKLSMDMLDGKLTIDGSYKSNAANKPEFDFNVQANSFQIPAAYKSFSMMQRYLPIASRSQGELSTTINFKGQFDEKLNIIPASLNGTGLLNTQNLKIIDSPVFEQLKGIINTEKIRNLTVDDFTAHFKMDNGNVNMTPFQTKIADQDVSVSGGLSVERILNLNMDFKVNRENLSGDINKALGILPGSENIKIIDATVLIKGDIKNPKVSVDLSKARKQIEQEVTRSTKENLEKSVKKVGDELKKLFK
ncbi:MAG: AsmA-like C-terminal region-containing protein [Prolixibacteraceae bacterium]